MSHHFPYELAVGQPSGWRGLRPRQGAAAGELAAPAAGPRWARAYLGVALLQHAPRSHSADAGLQAGVRLLLPMGDPR